jgi:hypothetical protein
MNWTTLYISGREDFREEVRKKLEHTDLKVMSGNIGKNMPGPGTDDLYWLESNTALRTFKEAVGGKLIWKYRLRFFANLEDFLRYQDSRKETGFTPEDLAMMDEMRGIEA